MKIFDRLVMVMVVATPALATARPIELGVTLGGHDFSSTSELGTADRPENPGIDPAGLVGVRLGIPVARRIAVEGEAVTMPAKDDVLGKAVTVYGLRAHVRFDVLTGKVRPFLVAGVGMQALRTSSMQMTNDSDIALHWGGGVALGVTPKLALRLDLRQLVVPGRTHNGAVSDFEVMAGATYTIGGAKRPRVVLAAVARTAEPTPDPDRDRDGIVNTRDTCPDRAENVNGWQDADGCPDEPITELTGIGFAADSARIDDDSDAVLVRAVAILTSHPHLYVEIAGHTSAEGTPEHNRALSLDRASAVKAWLVAHGVDATRLFAVGHGTDEPLADNLTEIGRRTNRRIEFRIIGAP